MRAPKRPPCCAERLAHAFDERLGVLRSRRVDEAGPVALARVAVDREVRDDEHLAADVTHRQVHLARRRPRRPAARRASPRPCPPPRVPSPSRTPSRTSSPRPIEATRSPSTETDADETRWTTARIARTVPCVAMAAVDVITRVRRLAPRRHAPCRARRMGSDARRGARRRLAARPRDAARRRPAAGAGVRTPVPRGPRLRPGPPLESPDAHRTLRLHPLRRHLGAGRPAGGGGHRGAARPAARPRRRGRPERARLRARSMRRTIRRRRAAGRDRRGSRSARAAGCTRARGDGAPRRGGRSSRARGRGRSARSRSRARARRRL